MQGEDQRVPIERIETGVPGLDDVLGGGIPAYSLNIVAGPPGSGKTTLVQQIIFHNATEQSPAVVFLALGEPAMKLLRYQQKFKFFDAAKFNKSVFYVDISKVLQEQGLASAMEVIIREVHEHDPKFVAIDSFKGLEEAGAARGENIRTFVHNLTTTLATWEATSFLVGEYNLEEIQTSPESSVADGILWLSHEAYMNTVVLKLRAIKMRGQAIQRDKHAFNIDDTGVTVYPRTVPAALPSPELFARERLAFGVPELDQMMAGGIPRSQSTLIAGSAGTGKTLLALHFLAEGVRLGEPSVMITFEESAREHEYKAKAFGWDLRDWQQRGLLSLVYMSPVDLSADEVMQVIHQEAKRLGARRMAINSISGFGQGLIPMDAGYFRESMFRLVATLSSEGVTTVMPTEAHEILDGAGISPEGVSSISDNIVLLRYVEIESELRKSLAVVKMRSSAHSKQLRQFDITDKGIVVREPFKEYSGILAGTPYLATGSARRPVRGQTHEPGTNP